MRYPRGEALGVPIDPVFREIPIGKAERLREGRDVVLLGLGAMVRPCLEAAELLEEDGVSTGVVNARFVKPLDEELLRELAESVGHVVTVEEAQRAGGFGSAVAELLQDLGLDGVRLTSIALPDAFVEHASPSIQRSHAGLTAEAIAKRALDAIRVVPVSEAASRPA
jgi:1-deoxy-D-xylulose-5-phosphate synthase